jgi:hypothetical protein
MCLNRTSHHTLKRTPVDEKAYNNAVTCRVTPVSATSSAPPVMVQTFPTSHGLVSRQLLCLDF